jgi:hypothetical protein
MLTATVRSSPVGFPLNRRWAYILHPSRTAYTPINAEAARQEAVFAIWLNLILLSSQHRLIRAKTPKAIGR